MKFEYYSTNIVRVLFLLISAGMLGIAPAQQVLFSEDFNDLSDARRPSNADWLLIGGADESFWYADNGGLNSGNLDRYLPIYANAFVVAEGSRTWTDLGIQADFIFQQNDGAVQLAVRYRPDNFYFAALNTGFNSAGQVYRTAEISKFVDGAPLEIKVIGSPASGTSNLPDFADGQLHRMELKAVGQELTLSLDGQVLLTATDREFSQGSAGLGARSTQILFDNVEVRGIGGLPAASGSGETAGGVRGFYRLLVISGMRERDASQEASNLSSAHQDVDARPWNGRYAVFQGKYLNEQQANSARVTMEEQGVFVEDVVFVPDSGTTPGTPGTQGRYRSLAGRFTDQSSAASLKNDLEARGIYPVEVRRSGNEWEVYAGFAAETQAESRNIAQELATRGVTQVEIVDLETGRVMAQLGGEELEPLPTAAAPDVSSYRQRVRDAMDRQEYSSARNIVTDWLELAPGDAEGQRLRKEIDGLLNIEKLRRDKEREATQKIAELRQFAREAETAGNLESAIEYYRQISSIAPNEDVRIDADREVSRLNLTIIRQAEDSPATSDGGGSPLIMAVGIILGFAALAVVIFFVLSQKKKKAPAPAKPATSATAGLGLSGMAPPVSAPAAPSAPQPPKGPSTPTESERIRPGVSSPAPATGESSTSVPLSTQAEPEQDSDPGDVELESDHFDSGALNLEGFTSGDTPSPLDSPTPSSIPAAEASPIPPSEASVIPPSSHTPIPVEQSGEFMTPPMPDSAPRFGSEAEEVPPSSETPQPVSAAAAKEAAHSGMYYAQNFEDEELGKLPSNWKGSYDYASLTVASREDAPGVSTKCMRFEKKTGSGAAYYSCRFPEVSGRVIVEFDLRCDDKNKYLLGFYIEKDEDFRHSIHTVVHRDTSRSDRVALRLQNVASPYKLGEWTHVRFLIDLQRSLVDGYVDDKPVAVGERLVSRPKVINTLSIRDNLATEGVLLIDNIKIYRDR